MTPKSPQTVAASIPARGGSRPYRDTPPPRGSAGGVYAHFLGGGGDTGRDPPRPSATPYPSVGLAELKSANVHNECRIFQRVFGRSQSLSHMLSHSFTKGTSQ